MRISTWRSPAGLIVLSCLAGGVANAEPAQFSGIGDLPGGLVLSEAFGVSGNGLRVVGYSSSGTGETQAVEFTGGVLTGIGDLAGGTVQSVAYAVSGFGPIVGAGRSTTGPEAFKFNQGRFRALGGTYAGALIGSAALAVSEGGARTVGFRDVALSPGFRLEAVLWDAAFATGLGYLTPGGSYSAAAGVSADGEVIVGGSDAATGLESFIWTETAGMVSIGDLPGGSTDSEALGISNDATTVVGYGNVDGGFTHAYRWTSATGMVDLGDLPGGTDFSIATAVNADGSVVVGHSGATGGTVAFIWTQADGLRNLRDVLVANGADLTGWTLTRAYGVSDNGRTIVGTGINPLGQTEGWVATLGSPAACPADFNGDGFLDFFDFDDFVTCFEGLSCPPGKAADFNNDGFADFFDYDDFVSAFESGC